MKRKILTLLSLIFAMVGILAVVTACKPEEEPVNPSEPTVVEEYYYDAAGSEYLLTLFTENKFKLEISPDTVEGEYALEGESLKLTLGDGSVINATVKNKTVNMTYKEKVYNFLLKVDYTVSFDTLGGSSVSAVKVRNGKTVAAPEAPTKGDEVFIDWYTDKDCKNLYYFSQPVTGDLTLYARFVKHVDPEFTVKFETGEGASEVDDVVTTGGKLFHLPTPVKEGSKFVGWYVSQFYSAEKLSYQYVEQPIEENITLYAVWDDGNPVVSVEASGIEVETSGVNDRFTITITAPDGSTKEIASQFTSNPYDFASMAAGEYQVSVTVGDKTTVRYFNNKALARVSVFKVEETTVLFNGVGNAQQYLLSVVCGTENHNHTDINLGTNRSWSFKNCDMPADGIKFVVKAMADGYVSSVSESFDFLRLLDKVSGLSVDPATEVASWSAVTGAKSYYVTVLSGDTEVFSGDVGTQTTFDLIKSYDAGEYTVKVKPVTRGWSSPAETTVTYTKNRLAAPTELVCDGKTLSWKASNGAEKYVVTVDGKTYEATGTSLALSSVQLDGGKSLYSVSVHAEASGKTGSLESDAITLRVALGDIVYRQGVLRWDPVLNVSKYNVKVGDSETVAVEGTSYPVTFTRAGDIKISVSTVAEGGAASSSKEITVKVYEITFDIDRADAGADIQPKPLYVADGDILDLPNAEEVKFYGYTFEAWYTAPNGMDGEGLRYDDVYFTDGQNRTLYAGWMANVHTITFDVGRYGNDDLKNIKMTIRFGEKITLPVAVSKYDEYTFSGWHYDNDGGTEVSNFKGEMTRGYLQDEDRVLYASYVVVFEFEDDSERGGVSVSKGPGLTGGMVTEARVPTTSGGKPVTRILDFTNCTSLEVLNIPDTVKLITFGTAGNVFQGCTALRAVNVYATDYSADAVYSSDDGVLLYNNPATYMKEVRYFPIAKSGEYTVPNGVTVIPQGAFYSATKLTKLNISYTVSEIQMEAFSGCTALEAIEFLSTPAGVSPSSLDIRENAFKNCTALKSIHFPARLAAVDASSLSALTGLTEITVEAGGTYSSIDGLLCKDYEGEVSGKEIVFAPKGKELGVYTIPVGVVSVGEKAFYEHPLLTGIVIPGYVVNIASEAFGHITVLESIEFTGTATDFDLNIQSKAFYAGYKTTSGSDSGTNTLVTELHLPANLKTVGRYAFGKYTKLTEVWVNTDRTEIEYADYVFAADNGSTNISYVTTAHIGPACPAFSYSGVFGSKLATIDVDAANPYVRSADSVVYDIEGANILFFPMDKGGDFVIPDGVLEIAPSAFADRDELVSISIPASVTVVGENAFNGCDKLTTVTFRAPEGGAEGQPLEIKQRAFYNCMKLVTIELPDRLEHLGTTIFYNCDGLVSIKLPKNLKTIDQIENSAYLGGGYSLDLFQQCNNLKEVTVDPANQYFTGIDGVLYATKGVKLSSGAPVTYEAYEALYTSPGATGEIKVPGTIRIVRTYAFRDINNVSKITFEDLVPLYSAEDGTPDDAELTFQQYALYGYNTDSTYGTYNSSVKEIILPKGLKTMGEYLIYNWKGLTSITIPNTVTSIAQRVFNGSYNIKEVKFEAGGTEGLRIEDGQSISESGHGVDYYGAFSYVSSYTTTNVYYNFTSFVLPARTTYIGNYAFYYQPLSSVTFDGEVSDLQIGKYAFGHCTDLTEFEIPEGTTAILDDAFYYAVLPELKLPESLETIGSYAFAYVSLANAQEDLVIPKNVTSIASYAFYDYYNSLRFKTVDLSAATKLTTIGNSAFYMQRQLRTVTFAKATEESPDLTIGVSAFYNCINLDNVTLPANVVSIGNTAFKQDYALKTFAFETYETGDNAGKCRLESIGNNVFEKAAITSFTFPESTAADGMELGEKIFIYCGSLTTVHLSKSVKNIDNVFTGCGKLQQVTVDADSKYFSEGKDANFPALYDANGDSVVFVYKAVDGEIKIGSGTKIGTGAFKGQSDITKVVIAASVQEIGENAFADCINLEEVQFTAGSVLTTIGEYAFQNCYNLTKINLEACTHLESSGGYVFQNCDSLVTLTLPSSMTQIGKYSFQYCYSLTDLKLPASLKTIDTYAFAYTGLKSLDLSVCTSLTDLANYALAYNTSLTSVKFPTSLAFLGTNTFRGSDNIKEIDLSKTQVMHLSTVKGQVQTANTGLFIFDCENLETVRLPAGFQSIGLNSFNGAANLKAIYIGSGAANDLSSLTSFQCGALQNCGIPSVRIPGSITYNTRSTSTSNTYYGTFENCSKLKSVEFVGGPNLREIPRSMFKGCTSLATVNFSNLTSLATIGQDAFRGCAFTSVDLSKCAGGSTFMTATYTFAECENLNKITLPSNVVKVGTYAFMGTGFTSINLADFKQFTTWGNYMFQKCLNLTEVTIPADVKLTASAGTYMFDGCESLQTVNIDKGYTGALPNFMFRGCTKLTDVNFNGAKVSGLGTNLFQNCTNLRSIDLSSATAAALGNYMFAGCEVLEEVTVPASIKTAGTYTFQNCTNLTNIDLSATQIDRLSSTATGNVTYGLAVHTFEGCTALEKVILPEGGVTQVGGQVFLNCTSLTDIENLDISKLTHIGKEAFRNCAYVKGVVTLNSNLQVLGESAFAECTGITSFKLTSGTTIDKVNTGSTSSSNPDQGYAKFDLSSGMVVGTKLDTNEVIIYALPYSMNLTGDTLKVTGNAAIAGYTFQNLKLDGVTKLDLSELTATSLPNYALAGAPFTEIVLPDAMTTLGDNTFSDCANLTTVHLPANLTEMGTYTFQNCVNLTKVDYPETLTSIPAYTFKGAGITEFEVPEQVTVIGAYAFQLSKLAEFTIPEWVTQLGQYAFSESELTSVVFKSDPQIIDNKGEVPSIVNSYLFNKCLKLKTVDFGPRTAIYANEFRGCGLETLTIPATITTVGGYGFSESELETIIFEGNPFDNASSMPNYVFQKAASLKKVQLPDNLVGMGTNWFNGCTSLADINLPETLTKIGSNCFQNCTSLTKAMVLPESIAEIGTNAFNGCVNIPSIELSANVGSIAANVFGGWTAAQQIRVRNSRFETCASCGVAWLQDIAAQVIFDYQSEA